MYKFKILECFKKQIKPHVKKFPKLKQDLLICLENFSQEYAISLGGNNYKIRLKSSDLQKGKNKSFRLIIHLIYDEDLIIPIAIYLKSQKINISKFEINQDLFNAINELKNLY